MSELWSKLFTAVLQVIGAIICGYLIGDQYGWHTGTAVGIGLWTIMPRNDA